MRTPFNLFPLLTGQLPAAISRRLVDHLTDTHQFWSRYPVPSVAMDDPKYDPFQMWRGPTWVNINYLLIEGLMRSGYGDLARDLRVPDPGSPVLPGRHLRVLSSRDRGEPAAGGIYIWLVIGGLDRSGDSASSERRVRLQPKRRLDAGGGGLTRVCDGRRVSP